MNIDPSGHSVVALLIFLAATTIAGGVIGGVTAYKDGARGVDLAKSIFLGSMLGLAVGGAIIATGAVIVGAFSVISGTTATIFGVAVKQAFGIGALAFDFVAYFIAPIFGFEMEGIEYEAGTPIDVPTPQPVPKHPGLKQK